MRLAFLLYIIIFLLYKHTINVCARVFNQYVNERYQES